MIRFGVSNGNLTVTTDTLVNGVATNVLTKSYTYDLNGNQLSETYTIPAAGNDPQRTVASRLFNWGVLRDLIVLSTLLGFPRPIFQGGRRDRNQERTHLDGYYHAG